MAAPASVGDTTAAAEMVSAIPRRRARILNTLNSFFTGPDSGQDMGAWIALPKR